MLTHSDSLVTLYRRANVSAFYAVSSKTVKKQQSRKKSCQIVACFFLDCLSRSIIKSETCNDNNCCLINPSANQDRKSPWYLFFHIYSILVDYYDISNIVRKLSQAILIPTKLGIIFVKIMASPEVERSPLTSPTNHQSRGYPKSQSHLSNSGEKRKMLNFRYVIPFLSMAYILAI